MSTTEDSITMTTEGPADDNPYNLYPANEGLASWDLVVVAVYFCAVVCVGIFAMCRSTRGTVSGYFLAGRSMTFLPVGASLFVSNIGSEHFIGLAGSGAAGGIGVGAWEFNAILLLQLLGWVFIPVYIACGTYTMPEYLKKRFGGSRIRVYFAFLSLLLYIFTKCSVDLYTGGLFIQQSLKWDLYLSILILIVITGFLTITGGLTAVIYTDTLQAFLMVGGALTLMGMSFWKLGGYGELVRAYPQAIPSKLVPNETCGLPPENAFQMLKEASDTDMPWAGFLFGQTPGSIWYWCSDQVIVQRALAAKSVSHAQGATLMAGFIKILPLFMMVMPGMISRVFYPDEVACADPNECYRICQSYAGCTNIAYPKLVLGVMPTGLRGLMMAVMIAALMSDLDSIFNSASTLFTIDVWKRFRKQASVRELMVVGRVFVLVMIVVAVAWVPVVKEMQGGQVFIYIQEVTNYLAPPVAAIFILGVIWPRINEQGVFWALMVALLTGVTRLILVFIWPGAQKCGDNDDRPAIIKDFQYMYFAMMLFWLTVFVAVIVSYCTEPPAEKHLIRTTFWTRHDKRHRDEIIMESKSGMHFDDVSKATTTSMETGLDNPGLENGESSSTLDSGKQTPVFTVSTNSDKDLVKFRDPNYQSQPTVEQEEWESRPWYKRACDWLIGIHLSPEEMRRQNEQQDRLLTITSLKQSRAAKIGLNIGLVLILSMGVALYVFWSFWQYEP